MTFIAVCGAAKASPHDTAIAEDVGSLLAQAGATLICGGLGGVMDAAARGASANGGIAIGILPGDDRTGASPHLTVSIPTGMGEARNALVVRSADAVIAIGGEFGTLSEIALAMKMGKRVVGIGTWELSKPDGGTLEAIVRATTAEEAVRLALETT